MPYRSLESLFRYFQPAAAERNNLISKGSVGKAFMDSILNVNGKVFSYVDIKNSVEKITVDPKDDSSAKKIDVAKSQFQAIGPAGPIDLGDEAFWSAPDKLGSVERIAKGANKTSIFMVKEPRLGPMTANADVVGQFLNYMPATIVNQMVPYLDVELQYAKNPNYTTTPGTLRFLLGSVPYIQLSSNDQAIFNRRSNQDYYSAGIETFLMPQSLNDMDAIGTLRQGTTIRTSPVKPFTPFISIEGFDMNTKGTGFGTIPVGRATLKLKLHDKSRISEVADLMRGAEGYSKITVKTRYGWSAPSSGDDNEYTKFINEKLYITQYWDVVQTNYTFDQSGQVSFSITLATKKINDAINGKLLTYSPRIEALNKKMAIIANYFGKIAARNLELPTTITSVVTEAANQGFFTSSTDKVNAAITKFEEQLKGQLSKFPQGFPLTLNNINELIGLLKSLVPTAQNNDTYAKIIEQDVKEGWRESFDSLDKTPDPFLPTDKSPRATFFGSEASDLASAINKFSKNKESVDNKEVTNKVVSFAKLFTHFLATPMQDGVDELQLIFYPMNGYCGPMSNRSIAEFPINMIQLRRGYYEIVKRTRTKNITISEFVSLLNSTNFQDPRAIGYDRTDLYPAVNVKDPTAKVEVKQNTETQQSNWFKKYRGRFVIPSIEIQIDGVRDTEIDSKNPNAPRKKIRRIHIFDKSSTFDYDSSSDSAQEKADGVRSEISVIKIGSNGSTVIAASGGSKTNSGQDTVFALRAYNNKGFGQGGTAIGEDGLGDQGDIPLRITPLSLTLTTLGCPIASNYQSFFIDFGTGTQLDNRYKVVEINHNLSPGKFTTTWRFLYDNAYANLVTPKIVGTDSNKPDDNNSMILVPTAAVQAETTPSPDITKAIKEELKKKEIKFRGKPKKSGT